MPVAFHPTLPNNMFSFDAKPEYWPKTTISCLNSTIRTEAKPIFGSAKTTFDFSQLTWQQFEIAFRRLSQTSLQMMANLATARREVGYHCGYPYIVLYNLLGYNRETMYRQRQPHPINQLTITFDLHKIRLHASLSSITWSMSQVGMADVDEWIYSWKPIDQDTIFDMLRLGLINSATLRLQRVTVSQALRMIHGRFRIFCPATCTLPGDIRRTNRWRVDLNLIDPDLRHETFADRSERLVQLTDHDWHRIETALAADWNSEPDDRFCRGAFEGEIEFSLM